MNFDSLKNRWAASTRALNTSRDSEPRDMNRRTSLERLAARYRSFTSMSAVMSVVAVITIINAITDSEFPFPVWLLLCMEFYFATAAIMDYWLFRGIRSLNCSTMTVETLLRKTLYYRKRHFQFMMVLIPMAIALIIAMCISFHAEIAIIYGMIAGFIIGLAIAVKNLMDFLRDYRNILS